MAPPVVVPAGALELGRAHAGKIGDFGGGAAMLLEIGHGEVPAHGRLNHASFAALFVAPDPV
jgi:hypothetical protein